MDINFTLIGFYIVLLTIIYSTITYFNTKNKLARLKLLLETKVTDEDMSLLDKLIQETFEEYIILNEAYKNIDFINSDEEKRLCSELSKVVAARISEAMFEKMSLVYNKDQIPTVIGNKIYLTIMNYSINTNKPK